VKEQSGLHPCTERVPARDSGGLGQALEPRDTSLREEARSLRIVKKPTGRDSPLPVVELNGLAAGVGGHCERSWPKTLQIIGSEFVHGGNSTQTARHPTTRGRFMPVS